jgi:hypothetical protein
MKALPLLLASCLAAASASAQVYRPEVGRRERPAPGPAERGIVRPPAPVVVHRVPPPAPRFHWGYPRDHGANRRFAYYPVYGAGYGPCYPAPVVVYPAPAVAPSGPAATGFWLGALAGGILGHNSGDLGHNAWRGAAWGAGAGLLLGSVVEASRTAPVSYREIPPPAPPVTGFQPPAAVPVRVVRPAGEISPLAEANVLFGR